ncbi:hypothetical protein HELRODRAFT_190316 [Helobdella robusta]|uniref:SBF1/SBF2 domain-containing protein n=1 Tax=Helobdella robusta TaxID=6412 RepID=T1FRW4_HELRO|nr:hypothetical protein HELRODRAFT_190316 [Helobdella robusta]ESO09888.1 hypothetical protein HELRODRAFT_190316 [Helobdella robusta]
MDFIYGKQASKDVFQETQKNLKSTFTDGPSKILGSVKKGFMEGLSSTIDQVVNIVGSNDENVENSEKQTPKSEQASNVPDTSKKPRPPKPPAPMGRQMSDNGSKNLSKTMSEVDEPSQPTARPVLKRRNTNPFMEGYEPAPTEADLPSTVVAEVYQMVSALYDKNDESIPDKTTVKERTEAHDDGDSEGTEGCDEIEKNPDDEITQNATEIQNWNDDQDFNDPISKECSDFMKSFISKIFETNVEINPKSKSKFCEMSQTGFGRLWFAEYILKKQDGTVTKIADETFYALIQFFTIVLFECNESEDYGPAKTLMELSFVLYRESDLLGILNNNNVEVTSWAFCRDFGLSDLVLLRSHQSIEHTLFQYVTKGEIEKQFLYSFLKDLSIWHSPKFWNAVSFFTVQQQRAAQTGNTESANSEHDVRCKQLRLITHYMRSLGVNKEQCIEYIKRQETTYNLSKDHVKQLTTKMEKWIDGCDPNEDESNGAMWFISQKAKAVNAAARLLKDGFNFRGTFKNN